MLQQLRPRTPAALAKAVGVALMGGTKPSGAAGSLDAASLGMSSGRIWAAAPSTPPQRTALKPGAGTEVASRHKSESGSSSMATVPSAKERLSVSSVPRVVRSEQAARRFTVHAEIQRDEVVDAARIEWRLRVGDEGREQPHAAARPASADER